jgi:hypothetical protein
MQRDRARRAPSILRGLGLAAVIGLTSACPQGIDTTRVAARPATLGDDIYGALCDRVGASSLGEDPEGASYHAVCHYDAKGHYADHVDVSGLPDVGKAGPKAEARRLGVAKVEAMARRRKDLVRALNALLPDVEIDDLTKGPAGSGKKIRLHDALFTFAQDLLPLYETNPVDPGTTPLLPTTTRALGRVFDAVTKSDAARDALSSLWGRQGYRPFPVGLGAIRPALAYKNLRPLAKAALAVLGPNAKAAPELQQLLSVVKEELATSKPVVSPLPLYRVDGATLQPNRPRTNIEVARALLVAEDPSFAASPADPPRLISKRDRRGLAIPLGNVPGQVGSVAAPFVDVDGDGFADADAAGRFVDATGAPLGNATPFAVPGQAAAGVDLLAPSELFTYVDTSRALTGAMARHMLPLVDATVYATPGDPDAWKTEHETLMYSLAGARTLFGPREDAQYDYGDDLVKKADEPCPSCLKYSRFRGEDSPLPAVLHAVGQVVGDADSDAIIEALLELVEKHEPTVARLTGAALRAKEIADEHDALAAKGVEPKAELPYTTPLWDEIAESVAELLQHEGLVSKLVVALADDTIVTPINGSQSFGQTLATFARMRDGYTYDPDDLNGLGINTTDGSPSTLDPHNPVDRSKPLTGDNRSELQRSFQIIHDGRNVKICNKENAYVYSTLGGLGPIKWPLVGDGYHECELFQFEDLAATYLDSTLPLEHPKRTYMKIKASTLNGIMDALGAVGQSPDDLFEQSSGITGMTTHPSYRAFDRLVFFGAESDVYSMPDLDPYLGNNQRNEKTNTFIHGILEPMPSNLCPTDAAGVPSCATPDLLLRGRERNAFLTWERLGFLEYLRPVVTVFANLGCTDDLTACDPTNIDGERMFANLLDKLHRHWPGRDHGPECDSTGTPETNGFYCSEAGGNRYEPIMADVFESDLLPALHEFSKVAMGVKITVRRGPHAGEVWTGPQILEKVTRILFDPVYAAKIGMVDRKGYAATTWVDGTVQPQLTGFTLFADALHAMDVRWDTACDAVTGQAAQDCVADTARRKGQWKRARSQLVDEFLAVDGEGTDARFRNAAFARTMTTLLRVVREQLNANCPDREAGTKCEWATKTLGDKLATTISGPLFASLVDVQESLRADETARRELERFLGYVLTAASQDDAFQATLASMSDLLQVLADDDHLSPIFNSIATLASPQHDSEGPGAADTAIRALYALVGDQYDRYHVLDTILPLAVTPMGDGELSPVEILLDTVAEVNRIDSAASAPLERTDYKAIMGTVKDFLTSETRGLEQFYFIVQNRPRE